MKKPNYNKMRLMLAKNVSSPIKKQYLELSDEDTMYEFIKQFSLNNIPKETV